MGPVVSSDCIIAKNGCNIDEKVRSWNPSSVLHLSRNVFKLANKTFSELLGISYCFKKLFNKNG